MQLIEGTGIPLAVFVDFFGPEFCPGCRQPEKTTVMAMPEATVNEDDCIIHGQHNVRSSGKFFDIDPVAEPAGEQLFPEEQTVSMFGHYSVRYGFNACATDLNSGTTTEFPNCLYARVSETGMM